MNQLRQLIADVYIAIDDVVNVLIGMLAKLRREGKGRGKNEMKEQSRQEKS